MTKTELIFSDVGFVFYGEVIVIRVAMKLKTKNLCPNLLIYILSIIITDLDDIDVEICI